MHMRIMRISRRFMTPEVADHTQEIEFQASNVLGWTHELSDECNDPEASGPVLHLDVATTAVCTASEQCPFTTPKEADKRLRIGSHSFVARNRGLTARHTEP